LHLTQREQTIVQIMLILLNPLIRDKPQDAKEQLIRETLRVKEIPVTEQELISIIDEITQEAKFTATQLFHLITKSGLNLSMFDPNMFKLKL